VNRESAVAGLTADDIASIWRIPKGAIYRYAHAYRWRRYTHAGRAYYHPDDVMDTLDRLARDEHFGPRP
jgi:hypothetical protein